MEPTVKKEDGRYAISMWQVTAAYKKVRSNRGAGGIDGMTWEGFDKQQNELLYKLWNRMTSGRRAGFIFFMIPTAKPCGSIVASQSVHRLDYILGFYQSE